MAMMLCIDKNGTGVEAEGSGIRNYSSLSPPSLLQQDFLLTPKSRRTVWDGRQDVANVVRGSDPKHRLLVIVGPCSIHDPQAALDYCELLLEAKEKHKDELVIIMRCYLEKPRTTIGWKGLINDPDMDGTFKINKGLRIARKLLIDINSKGMPVASEILDTISPQFISDLYSIGFVGARTSESQIHREIASGLGFPIGFKNGTDGSLKVAANAIGAAKEPHHFLSVSKHGNAAIVETYGNDDCFVVLRGSTKGTNYDAESTAHAEKTLASQGVRRRLMVDCSHGNSNKKHKNQLRVATDLANQIRDGRTGIMGVMLESNINEGNQQLSSRGEGLEYGISVTDACINWKDTEDILSQLANAVKERRDFLCVKMVKESQNTNGLNEVNNIEKLIARHQQI